ncbi:hypothetical protein [Pseudonocardia spinosispora]|uniref:hypothetical protein n=1 Tax=Pseudonocardia spinosispora TaxID=103441 RepID=UPI0003F9B879|nr:hypothetical protein [Pseudonocardia spinosispora]
MLGASFHPSQFTSKILRLVTRFYPTKDTERDAALLADMLYLPAHKRIFFLLGQLEGLIHEHVHRWRNRQLRPKPKAEPRWIDITDTGVEIVQGHDPVRGTPWLRYRDRRTGESLFAVGREVRDPLGRVRYVIAHFPFLAWTPRESGKDPAE